MARIFQVQARAAATPACRRLPFSRSPIPTCSFVLSARRRGERGVACVNTTRLGGFLWCPRRFHSSTSRSSPPPPSASATAAAAAASPSTPSDGSGEKPQSAGGGGFMEPLPAIPLGALGEVSKNWVTETSTSPRAATRMSLTIRSPSQRTRRSHTAGATASPAFSQEISYLGGGHSRRREGTGTGADEQESPVCGTSAASPHQNESLCYPPNHSTHYSSSAVEDGSSASYHRIEAMRSLSHFTEPVKRILLIRNGLSEANEDVSTYVSTPDWRIPLVDAGKRECVQAGQKLAELIGDEPVYVYYSPYIRSRQSLRYVLQGYDEGRQADPSRHEWWESDESDATPEKCTGDSSWQSSEETEKQAASGDPQYHGAGGGGLIVERHAPHLVTSSAASSVVLPHKLHDTNLILRSGRNNRIIGVREDVRLRDGDIGRYHNTQELIQHLEERERYGKFFYRFPYGESGADVCDRVTSFLDAFQRERVQFPMDTNVVIITHGLTIRMLIKRWFHLTVDTFHRMHSPPSGSIVALTRLHHKSCFRLDESCLESMNLPLSLNEHNGYKYRNKRLLGSMSSGAPYM